MREDYEGKKSETKTVQDLVKMCFMGILISAKARGI